MRGARATTGVALALLAGALACGGARSRMERALDPSMERLLQSHAYLRTVAGISSDPARLSRGDGFIYLADVAPQLRLRALTGDSAAYLRLRRFVEASMIRRDASGVRVAKRYRPGSPFEEASTYLQGRFGEALATGWRTFGDTSAAMLAAQLTPSEATVAGDARSPNVVERCLAAEVSAASQPSMARAVLGEQRKFRGGLSASEAAGLSLRGGDADLVELACLTRIAIAVQDPDATVRFLDALLGRIGKLQTGNGRPDPGAASDVLLALQLAEAAGPKYYGQK